MRREVDGASERAPPENPPALEESQVGSKDLAQTSPDGILATNQDGVLTFVNPALEAMFDIPSSVSLGTHFKNYITPESAKKAEGLFRDAELGKISKNIELEAVHHDKHVFPIEIAISPILEGGAFHGVECIVRDILRRKQAEEIQQESEQRLRRILEANPLGIVLIDASGRVLEANSAYLKIIGRSREDLEAGRIYWDRITPAEYLPRDAQAIAEAQAAGASATYEKEYLRPDGERVPVLVACATVDGKEQLAAFVLDITARKRTEEALRESEGRYRRLIENLKGSHFIYVHDTDGVFQYFSESITDVLGYTPGEFKAHYATYMTDHPANEAVRRHTELSIQGIRQPPYEVNIRHKDGSTRWLEVQEVPVFGAEGKVVAVEGVAQDITERKQAEEALRQSEQRYRKLFEANLAGVYVTKPDGTILDFNDAMMRMLGYDSREEVFQHRSSEFYADPEFRKVLLYLLKRDGVVPAKEAVLQRKDGSVLYALGSAVLLVNEQTGEPYIQGVAIDITERKQAEEALRELTRTLESKVTQRTAELERRARQLQRLAMELSQAEDRERKRLAEILHDDLQQQLAASKFHLGLLANRIKADVSLRQAVVEVKAMIADAIEKSRSLSRELSPAVLYRGDLGEAIEWLANQVHAKHGLVVHMETRGPIEVSSDPIKAFLFRTAQEILFNAVKHARVAEATVRLRRRRGQVWLAVCDRGRGFDPNSLGQAAGFGLLSIRERVELLGGRMKIRSAPGRGSTFLIAVPDREPVSESAQEAVPIAAVEAELAGPEPAPSERQQPLRVLVADDHEVMRQGLALLLQEEPDMEVVGEAGNGQEAVDLTHELKPDVVIMDMSMPVMNGDEATRQIKQHLPRTRVIALSMYDEHSVIEKMRRAGAEAYVRKTAPSEELLAAVRNERAQPGT